MKKFKIRELELLSGIKSHTIRIWEQRYAIFNPERSPGNVRSYSIRDVQYLLHLSLLIKGNHKISHLAKLDLKGLTAKVEAIDTGEAFIERTINELIFLMHSSEIEEFEDLLDSSILTTGVDQTVRTIIFPFLRRVQLLSYSDTSSNTHFVVTALRKKIILAIEAAKPQKISDLKALLFLPEGEHFDLLLLYVSYLIKSNGITILYLGTNVSTENIESVSIQKEPDLLVTHLPGKQVAKLAAILNSLPTALSHARLIAVAPGPSARFANHPALKVIPYADIDHIFLDPGYFD